MNDNITVDSKKVVSNLIWRFLERFGAYIVSFVVSLILARIFAENRGVYGSIAIVTSIIAILQVFVDSGLGNALIQKKDADSLDFSTVFWFNLIACIGLYAALFFLAPVISSFYKGNDLTLVIRILGISLIISGSKNVLQAYISRHLLFKKFFLATITGTVSAAVVGILMAVKGYGIWALVIQHLVNLFVDTLIIWISVKWKPSFCFSFKRFKTLFNFGYKLLLSALLDTGYKELRTFIIGFKYSDIDLADYNRGKQFPEIIVSNINSSIDSVLLPVMSKSQNDVTRVKEMTRRSIKISTFIMMPMMIGLAVVAKPLVSVLLTDAWLDCVPFIQIFCISFAFYPLHTANLNAVKALGKSNIFLVLEFIKKAIGIISIIVAMWFGTIWLALIDIPLSIISLLVNSFPNRKLLNYSYKEQFLDIFPQLAISIVMGCIVLSISFIPMNNILILVLQIIVGIAFYFCVSALLKIESFIYLINFIKNLKYKNSEVLKK